MNIKSTKHHFDKNCYKFHKKMFALIV